LRPLLTMARTYILDNFERFANNDELLNEITQNELADLLEDDNLNVLNEQVAFGILLKWILLDTTQQKRVHLLGHLLSKIKLPLLSSAFIARQIEVNNLIKNNCECLSLMLEAATYHMLPERFSSSPTSRTRPRNSTIGYLLAIGGNESSKNSANFSSFIEKYDFRLEKWSLFNCTPSQALTNTTNTNCNNNNGTNSSSSNATSTNSSNNNVNSNITNNPSHITKRLQFGVAIFNNQLYLVGGRDGLKTLNYMECFDIDKECWHVMPQMITHRHGLQAAFLTNEPILYAVGGHVTTFFIYNFKFKLVINSIFL
jgi:kelch-like protein 1/4/5